MRFVNPGNDIDQADWMTLGALRSSENWFVDYWNTDQELGGITTAWELANWLGDAGYTRRARRNQCDPRQGRRQSAGSKQVV